MFSTSLGKLEKKSPGKVVDFLSNSHQKSENGWTQAGFRKKTRQSTSMFGLR